LPQIVAQLKCAQFAYVSCK